MVVVKRLLSVMTAYGVLTSRRRPLEMRGLVRGKEGVSRGAASVLLVVLICCMCASANAAPAWLAPGANDTHQVTGNARISGNVEVCQTNFGECRPISTTVAVLTVHGSVLGSAVATQYARRGQFVFSLPPGKYFLSVGSGLKNSRRCISGEVSVRPSEHLRDNVTCYIRTGRH